VKLINTISRYRKAYRNWVSVLYNFYKAVIFGNGSNHKVKVVLRSNGEKCEAILGLVDFYTYMSEHLNHSDIKDICIENNEISFTFNGHKLKFIEPVKGDVIAVFANEEYKFLNPKDEVVIDIGANIGDSPIYFCVEGTKKGNCIRALSLHF